MIVTDWANRVIRWGFYLLFILVPLILTPWNFELFEYNKMMLTYGLTVIILGAWAMKMIHARELRIAKTPLDIPLGIFVASQLVSTLFSIDPHVSWFGYYSRFNGGMFSILTYVALYYAFVSNWTVIKKLPQVLITTAAVVALYGVLEHFGIDKNLWVQDVQSRVFSTLGQPNWLAAYLVALIPLSFAIYIQKSKFSSLFSYFLSLLFSLLFFIVLLFTRSRSGYLGLAVADVVFWGLLFLSTKLSFKAPQNSALHRLRLPFIIYHLSFIIIIFVNGVYVEKIDRYFTFQGLKNLVTRKATPAPVQQLTPSGTALESGGTESGVIRKYVWQGALNAWRGGAKNILIGTGTETFAFAFYQYRPIGHNNTSEWDFLYNKAHNEYLNYLATTGLFGLGSYLLLIGSFIFWFVKKCQSIKVSEVSIALFAGWSSILLTNFFGFSVVIVQLFLFLFPAIIIVLINPDAKYFVKKLNLPVWTKWFAVGITLTIIIILVRFWKADTLYASGNRLGRSGQNEQARVRDSRAIALNPGEPVYHDDLASVLAALSLSAAQEKNATAAADFAKQSLAESSIAITTSPQNVNFWKTRTKLYYTFSSFDPTLNSAAIDTLEKAAKLSPNDPKIYYNLAILEGRDGNNEKALEYLQKAKTLKPNYRDAYFGLYVFYTELKKPDEAKAELQQYLDRVDPNDKDFQERIAQ